jgi:hypothetical protein
MRRILFFQTRREAYFLEIFAGPVFGFAARQAEHMDWRFDDVLDHVHVRPQVEVLEHHRQFRADALQLLVIGHFQIAGAVGFGLDHFAVDDDLPRVRPLQKIDAAQEGALARSARADDADHVALVRVQRDALEHFIVAVAFMDVLNGELASFGLSRVEQDALPLKIRINLSDGAQRAAPLNRNRPAQCVRTAR